METRWVAVGGGAPMSVENGVSSWFIQKSREGKRSPALGLLTASSNKVRVGAWRWQNHHHGEGSPSAYL